MKGRSFNLNIVEIPMDTHEVPMDLSLKASLHATLCQMLFDISKKTDLTSRVGLQSNASNILCVIASS